VSQTDIRTVEIEHEDGIVPAYISGEAGPGVLLLAGGNSASRDYYPRIRESLPACRVIGIDRPGSGHSRGFARTDLAYSCRVLAETLEQIIDEPVVVVGHSMGGIAAVHLAVDAPDQVRSLLLLDPTPFDDQMILQTARAVILAAGAAAKLPGMAERLRERHNQTWRNSLGALDADAERSLQVIGGDIDLRAGSGGIKSSPGDSRRLVERLDKGHRPVVIVTADRKPTSRTAKSHRRLAQQMRADLRTWPGTAHALQLQRPADVVATIQELLDTRA
jgi:lipase